MMNVGLYLSIGVFFKPVSQEMGWSRAETALPISVSTIVTATMTIIAGSLVDKYGPRKIAFIFALLAGAGYLLMSGLSSLWQLYLYFGVLIGAGASLMAPLLSLVPRWFSASRTVMAGVISAGGGVGGLIMPLVANWLITAFSWRQAYLILGIVYFIVVLAAVQFLRRSPATGTIEISRNLEADISQKSPVPAFSLKEALRSRNYWLMVTMCFVFGYVANTINVHSAPHATDIGISSAAAAGLLSVMNGFSIIGCVALGMLGDKFGNQKMLILTFVIEGAALLWLTSITGLWTLNVFMIIYGVAFGSGLAQSSPMVAKLFGTRSLGLILGTISFVQTIGAGFGSYIPGVIYDINQDYRWAFTICGILCLLAIAAAISLRQKTDNRTPVRVLVQAEK
jgi:MFS family permease